MKTSAHFFNSFQVFGPIDSKSLPNVVLYWLNETQQFPLDSGEICIFGEYFSEKVQCFMRLP